MGSDLSGRATRPSPRRWRRPLIALCRVGGGVEWARWGRARPDARSTCCAVEGEQLPVVEDTATGPDNDALRKLARSAIEFAQRVKHSRPRPVETLASPPTACSCSRTSCDASTNKLRWVPRELNHMIILIVQRRPGCRAGWSRRPRRRGKSKPAIGWICRVRVPDRHSGSHDPGVNDDQHQLPEPLPLAQPGARRPPLPKWTVPVAALVVLAVAGGTLLVLWQWIDGLALVNPADKDRVSAQLDAIKTALGIAVGGGGLFALYLAARRQRTQELELAQRERAQVHVEQVAEISRLHAERVADASESDAAARRVTELYTAAVEQLGSDKAPVRLGGLYALERLAQDNSDPSALRQTVVNVLCAYLRMPWASPGDAPPEEADESIQALYERRVQEREVRLTAQRILRDHLRPGADHDQPVATFWGKVTLDLTGATLVDLDLAGCRLHHAGFAEALFTGDTSFEGAWFERDAQFEAASFSGEAKFAEAWFAGDAQFTGTRFAGDTGFERAAFAGTSGSTRRRSPGRHGSTRRRSTPG